MGVIKETVNVKPILLTFLSVMGVLWVKEDGLLWILGGAVFVVGD